MRDMGGMVVGWGAAVLSNRAASPSLMTVLRGWGTLDVLSIEGVLVSLWGPAPSVCTRAVVTGGQCAVVGASVWRSPVTKGLLGLVLGARGEWL